MYLLPRQSKPYSPLFFIYSGAGGSRTHVLDVYLIRICLFLSESLGDQSQRL
nr:MAG TPA: hypothetical protein [Caudoviricetes sp.]